MDRRYGIRRSRGLEPVRDQLQAHTQPREIPDRALQPIQPLLVNRGHEGT